VHKRVSDLITAFALVHERFPKTKLLIVGDAPDDAVLRSLASQLGVAEYVCFAGYQGDTRPFYEVIDIFALASAYEGLPLALLEALFARLPVVATRVGGIPTVVKVDETGYLVEPKAPLELADKLIALANDAPLRPSMGQAGLVRARAEFTADRYLRQYDELYQSLAARRNID
jgi:L-malate glycosyltransferase